MIPVFFEWKRLSIVDNATGEIIDIKAMVPLDRFANVAASQFDDNEKYRMEIIGTGEDERTDKEHRSYMAQVNEGWKNLPEDKAKEYPTPTHLRKRALIKCGYHHETSTVFDTDKQAIRAAAFMKPLFEYDVVIVSQNVVKHFRAMTQSYHRAGGMNKEQFRESRDRVLDLIASLLDVKRSELKKAGDKPAP